MNKEYAIKVKELNEQMRSSEYVIKAKSAKNAEILLEVLLITLGILAGGLLTGAVFDLMLKAMVISLVVDGLVVFDRVSKIVENKDIIKRNERKIFEIEKQIREISDKEYEKVKEQNIVKEKKNDTTKKNSSKYSYNSSSSKTTSQKKDIPIEFFDESDFLDEPEENNHKKR